MLRVWFGYGCLSYSLLWVDSWCWMGCGGASSEFLIGRGRLRGVLLSGGISRGRM